MGTRRSVVAVAVVGLFLTGCTDGGSGSESGSTLPDRTDSSSASASPTVPSASPTPTDPTAALEAEINAFFEEYIATVNESWTSEEALARRRQMFADSCVVCLRGYEFTERAHVEGLEFQGLLGSVTGVQLTSAPADQVSFLATIDSPAAALVDDQGVVRQEFEAYPSLQTVYQARRSGESWLIVAGDSL